MKTKLIRTEGWYRLAVDDPEINSHYCERLGISQCKKPVILVNLTHFFDSGHWSIEDFRLSEFIIPSPYLSDSMEVYTADDEDDYRRVIGKLHTYETDSNNPLMINWNRFNCAVFDGGDNIPSPGHHLTPMARFKFKTAMAYLQKTREFWDSVEGNRFLPEHMLENNYRQLRSSSIIFEKTLKELKDV